MRGEKGREEIKFSGRGIGQGEKIFSERGGIGQGEIFFLNYIPDQGC